MQELHKLLLAGDSNQNIGALVYMPFLRDGTFVRLLFNNNNNNKNNSKLEQQQQFNRQLLHACCHVASQLNTEHDNSMQCRLLMHVSTLLEHLFLVAFLIRSNIYFSGIFVALC